MLTPKLKRNSLPCEHLGNICNYLWSIFWKLDKTDKDLKSTN